MEKAVSDRYRCPERFLRAPVPALEPSGNGTIDLGWHLLGDRRWTSGMASSAVEQLHPTWSNILPTSAISGITME
jgi:hypothetical protein